jgi:hypothetical protein
MQVSGVFLGSGQLRVWSVPGLQYGDHTCTTYDTQKQNEHSHSHPTAQSQASKDAIIERASDGASAVEPFRDFWSAHLLESSWGQPAPAAHSDRSASSALSRFLASHLAV